MSQFTGTFTNKIDGKGRISIPAPYRPILRALCPEGSLPLMLRPSHKYPCLEGWPPSVFAQLAPGLESLDFFNNDQDDLALTLYSDAFPVDFDSEGRVLLADSLLAHANIEGAAMILGSGRIFQIWEPAAGAQRLAAAREAVRVKGLTLAASATRGGA